MTEEMIQIRKQVHDETMGKMIMALELIETAVESFQGTDDTPTQTLVKCAYEKIGEATQLFIDMDPRNQPDYSLEAA